MNLDLRESSSFGSRLEVVSFDDVCHSIQLLLLDVDGVLTDGTI